MIWTPFWTSLQRWATKECRISRVWAGRKLWRAPGCAAALEAVGYGFAREAELVRKAHPAGPAYNALLLPPGSPEASRSGRRGCAGAAYGAHRARERPQHGHHTAGALRRAHQRLEPACERTGPPRDRTVPRRPHCEHSGNAVSDAALPPAGGVLRRIHHRAHPGGAGADAERAGVWGAYPQLKRRV